MKHNNILLIYITISLLFLSAAYGETEIKEYQGKRLSDFNREYDNSIKGPQSVDVKKYRLEVSGLVETPLSMSYDEILRLPVQKRTFTLHCVEGWSETLLFEGIRLADIFDRAKLKNKVKTVIFYAADGYSSSLTYDFVKKYDIMLAYKINGKTLDAKRGFPLQVVAESKFGYKWVKWVTKIELSKDDYQGYWEKKGYSNEDDVE